MFYNFFFNFELFDFKVWKVVLLPIPCTVCIIAIDGLFAAFVRRLLPEKWFSKDVKIHHAPKWERKFYEFLGIRWWKDKVLELGMFTAFSKKEVQNPASREYIEKFIVESNFGVFCHIFDLVFAFLILLAFPPEFILTVTPPAATVNAFLSFLPTFILRYNVPRLLRIYDILEKKENRTASL